MMTIIDPIMWTVGVVLIGIAGYVFGHKEGERRAMDKTPSPPPECPYCLCCRQELTGRAAFDEAQVCPECGDANLPRNTEEQLVRRDGESLAAFIDRVDPRPPVLLPGIDYPFSDWEKYGGPAPNDSLTVSPDAKREANTSGGTGSA